MNPVLKKSTFKAMIVVLEAVDISELFEFHWAPRSVVLI